MSNRKPQFTRRDFITGAGALGLGAAVSATAGAAETTSTAATAREQKVPTRIFGKTKIPVSTMSLGCMFDIVNNQVVLKKCLDLGVTYWDTAHGYNNGNSELGIGAYFEKFPEVRKQIFLVTKSGKRDIKGIEEHFNLSLERMKTDYIDLYFYHAVTNIDEITPELKEWAEKKKAAGKIKFIGFSTHRNMETLLAAGAKLGWLDGIMMTYNFRNMQTPEMKAAVEACQKAGIGLTAMKIQGGGPIQPDAQAENNMAAHFLKKGFTPEQAKIKAVLQNDVISAACCTMKNLALLTSFTAAAMDKTPLADADLRMLDTYARQTASVYCAGCSEICSAACAGAVPVAEVMRYMMYHTAYGETHLARQHFAELPDDVRRQLFDMDYSEVQRACPHGIDIAGVIRQARDVLA